MTDIRKLLKQISAQEDQLRDTQFLAPCVHRGRVRTKVAGIVYTFTPDPRNFEGWGIFQPATSKVAKVVEEAELQQVTEYLQQMPAVRLSLAYQLQKQTWLAYPVNESDVRQRIGCVKPVPVYLVSEGATFEPIIARWDGCSWWFEEIDRRADPIPAEALREALKQVTPPAEVRFKGMTPEMRTVYQLVAQQTKEFEAQMQQQWDEKRLQKALKMGGGQLQKFHDRDDYWIVEWTTGNGEQHTSAISKNDLTAISAGICLSGFDRNFDLQSLVGVVEDR
ncbi:hypothetical protein [Microcoleus sp. FACHB-672]|uniref:hypothetical protein n=1 Tax=Microcoleus sp. FACHB-672 TaxID=2692825 RepID=UPI0016898104|nr:hypothetical protein [Microcoleus sp. FACHB-672]MBD2039171.1 hypothetical protein [Microcoleus sp. FACHB-672]